MKDKADAQNTPAIFFRPFLRFLVATSAPDSAEELLPLEVLLVLLVRRYWLSEVAEDR